MECLILHWHERRIINDIFSLFSFLEARDLGCFVCFFDEDMNLADTTTPGIKQ